MVYTGNMTVEKGPHWEGHRIKVPTYGSGLPVWIYVTCEETPNAKVIILLNLMCQTKLNDINYMYQEDVEPSLFGMWYYEFSEGDGGMWDWLKNQ